MTSGDLIKQIQEDAAEWLEMSDNPAALTVGILAHKVIQLQSYVEYLERSLQDVRRAANSR